MAERLHELSPVEMEYATLQNSYIRLQDGYEQLKTRLHTVERQKVDVERRHQQELMKLTGEMKFKIQTLETLQKRNEIDLEEMKETTRNELNVAYERRTTELTDELERQRQIRNEISFQYAILKKEFDALRRTRDENEDKFRLQNDALRTELEQEKRLLTTRIEQLSNAAVDVEVGANREKISALERNRERLETELKISNDQRDVLDAQLKSERRTKETFVEALQKDLKSQKAISLNLQHEFDVVNSENAQLQATIEQLEKKIYENERIIQKLSVSNETLEKKLKNDVDEVSDVLKVEIIRLEKQHDELQSENKDLLEKLKTLENDLTTKNRQVNEFELRLEEVKQNFKKAEFEHREILSNEKKDVETKLRDVETERTRIAVKYERNLHNLELKLKQSEFEKEKIADALASLKVQVEQQTHSTKKLNDEEKERNSVVKNLSNEIETLKNDLRRCDDLLKTSEQKFESFREKNVQFYEILKLLETHMNKPNAPDEDDTRLSTDTLMNDIKKELKKLNRSGGEKRVERKFRTKSKEKIGERA